MTLTGRQVRLEPLSPEHVQMLSEVGLAPDLWRWTPYLISTPGEMRAYVDSALRDEASGIAVPFATVDLASGRVAGSTRFMNIDTANRRVEIGATWLAPAFQRTGLNTEAKYLMLRHAFETLGCIRVELKTDSLNERSRQAILRIGAKFEGIFRNHIICYGGRIRHTAWFSIVDADWPEVRERLEEKLSAYADRSTPARCDTTPPSSPASAPSDLRPGK